MLPTTRAAAIQAEPVVLDRDATVSKACDLIAEAAVNGANLVVFPELFIPTFVNSSILGARVGQLGVGRSSKGLVAAMGERRRDRRWRNGRLCRAAGEAGVNVAMGLHERQPRTRTLFNTLLLISDEGVVLGKHRKLVRIHVAPTAFDDEMAIINARNTAYKAGYL